MKLWKKLAKSIPYGRKNKGPEILFTGLLVAGAKDGNGIDNAIYFSQFSGRFTFCI